MIQPLLPNPLDERDYEYDVPALIARIERLHREGRLYAWHQCDWRLVTSVNQTDADDHTLPAYVSWNNDENSAWLNPWEMGEQVDLTPKPHITDTLDWED